MRRLSCVLLSLACACGGADPQVVETEESALCSERAAITDGVAMSVGCSFVQQTHNVRTNGRMLDVNGIDLFDANGSHAAKVTHVCGEWLLASDDAGTTIVVSEKSGQVRSHGTLHTGEGFSSLPSELALPLSY